VEEFTRALQSNPQSAATWFDRGCARIALGEYPQALADLDEAVRLDPREARFHYGRGVAQSRLDQHKDALESFTRAQRLEPDLKDVFLERALCLRALGQDDEALRVSSVLASRDVARVVEGDSLDRPSLERARRAAGRLAHLVVLRSSCPASEWERLTRPWRPLLEGNARRPAASVRRR